MKHHRLALAVASFAIAFSAASATASAGTGSLRVVAPDGREIFPGVANLFASADPGPLQFTTSDTEYRCDAGVGAVTAGRAISLAARKGYPPFSLEGTFDPTTGQPTFTRLAGQDLTPDAATGKHFSEWINGLPATRGACGDALKDGDRILFAWGKGDERVLHVDLPAYSPCRDFNPLKVTDEATGEPVEGARVGNAITDAQGMTNAPSGGAPATKDGYIQSGVSVFIVPAIGCAQPQPVPQPSPQPEPQPQPQPAPQPAQTAPKVTIKVASRLQVGALRLTAGSNRPGTAEVTAKIGGVAIKRSVTFSKAGSVTFKLATTSAQRKRLRRALKRGAVAARVSISLNGNSATVSAKLRR